MEKIMETISLKQVRRAVPAKYRKLIGEVLPIINDSFVLIDFLQATIGNDDRESFVVIGLNTEKRITSFHRSHVGTLNSVSAHPRDVFKSLILNNCDTFIVAHNHPTGSCKPSTEDEGVTETMKKAGNLLGIELIDHLIITPTDFYSFKSNHFL